jgi:hypothetical protein
MQPRLAVRRLERIDLHNCSRYARLESNKTLLNLGERPIRGLGGEGNEDACGDLDHGVREPLNPASAKGKASPPTPSRRLHHSGPSGKCYWSSALSTTNRCAETPTSDSDGPGEPVSPVWP